MITALLIANRGEIACRIIRTCRRLGIRAVAVYSDADARAAHVELADESVRLGPAPAHESYLAIGRVIDAARRAGADAVHPGVGFLAENSAFAEACAAAGLSFIGPPAPVIAAIGDKRAARELAEQASVPLLPGYSGADQSDDALQRAAGQLGWPLMVKPAAGGGGKGMRLVRGPDELDEAIASARREARQAFGADALILERALAAPRHIEFQIFGDQHGNLLTLGERECSIQRRYQKVIEETPSPALTPELRAAMGVAAIRLGRAAGYSSAGTVEFLLDRDGRFYFLEVNTRLQVEHPVTECVTGLDLVEWQIRVAEGQPLPLRQDEVRAAGHAIEARLYAESGFLPATGQILLWREPAGEGVRVDGGIRAGDHVTIHYDPMLAKIIASGPDRATACRRLARALETASLLGVGNNRMFLRAVLDHPAFLAGDLSTDFLADHFADWAEPQGDLTLALVAAALVQWSGHPQVESNPGYWRNNPSQPQLYRFAITGREEPIDVRLTPGRQGATYQIALSAPSAATLSVELNELDGQVITLTVDGRRQRALYARDGDRWWVQTRAGVARLRAVDLLPEPKAPADAGGSLRAPMPGVVLAVLVAAGRRVARGDALIKLEAMKMEYTIRTAADGVVAAIHCAPGDLVEAEALLIEIGDERLFEEGKLEVDAP